MTTQFYIAVPLMALLTIIQAAILNRFPMLGVSPQLIVLFALSWGLLRSTDAGIVWAFVGGIMNDLFSASPIGATAVALIIAVLAVTLLQQVLPPGRVLMPLLLTVIGLLLFLFINLLLLRLAGSVPSWAPLATAPPYILISAIFMLPIYWALYAIINVMESRVVERTV